MDGKLNIEVIENISQTIDILGDDKTINEDSLKTLIKMCLSSVLNLALPQKEHIELRNMYIDSITTELLIHKDDLLSKLDNKSRDEQVDVLLEYLPMCETFQNVIALSKAYQKNSKHDPLISTVVNEMIEVNSSVFSEDNIELVREAWLVTFDGLSSAINKMPVEDEERHIEVTKLTLMHMMNDEVNDYKEYLKTDNTIINDDTKLEIIKAIDNSTIMPSNDKDLVKEGLIVHILDNYKDPTYRWVINKYTMGSGTGISGVVDMMLKSMVERGTADMYRQRLNK